MNHKNKTSAIESFKTDSIPNIVIKNVNNYNNVFRQDNAVQGGGVPQGNALHAGVPLSQDAIEHVRNMYVDPNTGVASYGLHTSKALRVGYVIGQVLGNIFSIGIFGAVEGAEYRSAVKKAQNKLITQDDTNLVQTARSAYDEQKLSQLSFGRRTMMNRLNAKCFDLVHDAGGADKIFNLINSLPMNPGINHSDVKNIIKNYRDTLIGYAQVCLLDYRNHWDGESSDANVLARAFGKAVENMKELGLANPQPQGVVENPQIGQQNNNNQPIVDNNEYSLFDNPENNNNSIDDNNNQQNISQNGSANNVNYSDNQFPQASNIGEDDENVQLPPREVVEREDQLNSNLNMQDNNVVEGDEKVNLPSLDEVKEGDLANKQIDDGLFKLFNQDLNKKEFTFIQELRSKVSNDNNLVEKDGLENTLRVCEQTLRTLLESRTKIMALLQEDKGLRTLLNSCVGDDQIDVRIVSLAEFCENVGKALAKQQNDRQINNANIQFQPEEENSVNLPSREDVEGPNEVNVNYKGGNERNEQRKINTNKRLEKLFMLDSSDGSNEFTLIQRLRNDLLKSKSDNKNKLFSDLDECNKHLVTLSKKPKHTLQDRLYGDVKLNRLLGICVRDSGKIKDRITALHEFCKEVLAIH